MNELLVAVSIQMALASAQQPAPTPRSESPAPQVQSCPSGQCPLPPQTGPRPTPAPVRR